MVHYKVVYFDARARAEPTRMLLAYAGQDFEDVRYNYEQWGKAKADTPFQQIPFLEVDGKPIPQSVAMHGFVARQFGLNGANNKETTKIEVILGVMEDLRQPLIKILFKEKDESKTKNQLAAYYAETAPRFLKGLEEILKNNSGGDGFFVGSKLSRADIVYFSFMEPINKEEDVLKQFPKLNALKDRIAKDPKIAAYLAKRPVLSLVRKSHST